MRTSEYFHTDAEGCKVVHKAQYMKELPNKEELKTGPKINGKYCAVHSVAICRCGWEWTHHPLEIKNPEKNMKRNCFLCGRPINKKERTLERYLEKGNTCDTCISRVDRSMLPESNPRYLTQETADKFLAERRLKYNYISK